MLNAAATPNCDDDDDEGPTVPIGGYEWNRKTGEFLSDSQGRGQIVAWIDGDGEVYEPDELDEFVDPVLATVELLEGDYAGSFVNVDVEEDTDDYETVLLN